MLVVALLVVDHVVLTVVFSNTKAFVVRAILIVVPPWTGDGSVG